MDKQELRKFVRQLKTEHQSTFAKCSQSICDFILRSPQFRQAHTVLLYHALADEPDLGLLLDEALYLDKQVLLPVVVGDDLVMSNFKSHNDLKEGAFHILEPQGKTFPTGCYDEIDLALVPGVAFDNVGHRLGRGRGYYDRLLPRLSRAYKMGICFPFQLFPAIPSEPHDVLMDEVVAL